MFGLGAGSVTGMVGHLVLQTLQKRYIGDASSSSSAEAQAARQAARKVTSDSSLIYKVLRPLPPLGKNTFMLSLLGGGALGSFVMSTTAGKNVVHMLHPIFSLGKTENAGKSPYQIGMLDAGKAHDEVNATTGNSEEDELDAAHHRTRSLSRKASMKRRLETGQSLSDTHGNTWPSAEEDTEEMQKDKSMHRADLWDQRQTNRRNTVRDRIVGGKALSNSTGGHWSEQSEGDK